MKIELYERLKNTPKAKRVITKRRLTLRGKQESGYDVGGADDLVDDGFLTQFFADESFYNEGLQYKSLKLRERLTVNMLQCLANTPSQTLREEIREKALKAFVRTEEKLHYRGNAYLYLVRVCGAGDPYKLIAELKRKRRDTRAATLKARMK